MEADNCAELVGRMYSNAEHTKRMMDLQKLAAANLCDSSYFELPEVLVSLINSVGKNQTDGGTASLDSTGNRRGHDNPNEKCFGRVKR